MGAKIGGGGGGRFDLGQNSDINVTPFVDVMLVLLIIFMVAIPAATVSIKLDLPPAVPPPPPPSFAPIFRFLTQGRFWPARSFEESPDHWQAATAL